MFGLGWKPFDRVEEHQIVTAIAEAEVRTSGEIKIHIDKWCKTSPVYKAQNKFQSLGMHQTEERNGVLIYLALKEHKIAIIGDEGINSKVPPGFWDSTFLIIQKQIQTEGVVSGICSGIAEAANQLSKHFPPRDNDTNELSNDISYG